MKKLILIFMVLSSLSLSAKSSISEELLMKAKVDLSSYQSDKDRFNAYITLIDVMDSLSTHCKVEVQVRGRQGLRQPPCNQFLRKRFKYAVFSDWYFEKENTKFKYRFSQRSASTFKKVFKNNQFINEYIKSN